MSMNVRVDDESYKALLAMKHRLEKKERHRVPIGATVKELLKNQKED